MIKIIKNGLANVLLALSKKTNELDKKIISLINTINKVINASTSRTKLCLRLVLGFDKKY